MRDLLIVLIVFGLLPFCFTRPSIGILLFSWLSYMNPHRLAYGFAFSFPFAQIVALATIIGLFVGRDEKRFPWCSTVVIWILLIVWIAIATLFSMNFDVSLEQLEKVLKIQLMAFITLVVMGSREKIVSLVWVIAMSIAFYGAKGGVFAIVSGGGQRVWGPPGTFIAGNNEMGLAMVMTLPLIWFLQQNSENKYIRWGLYGVFGLTVLATLATQSRGALLGICAMIFFLWIKSRHKMILGVILLLSVPSLYLFMPQSWHDRMSTIAAYQQDGSAQSRLIAWEFGVLAANARFTGTGPGFSGAREAYEVLAPDFFAELLEEGGNARAAHSIYFGMLGQNGWVGLTLFLMLGLSAWRCGSFVLKRARDIEELKWATNLAAMLQVSLVGYASTGAFLSLEYFDYFYHIIGMLVLLKMLVKDALAEQSTQEHGVALQAT